MSGFDCSQSQIQDSKYLLATCAPKHGDCKLGGEVFHKTGTITSHVARPLLLGGVGVDVLGVCCRSTGCGPCTGGVELGRAGLGGLGGLGAEEWELQSQVGVGYQN